MQSIVLISNLHCGSCVSTIEDTLSVLSPPPISIRTSIVAQSVTVEHTVGLPLDVIKKALDDAGFDLVSTPDLENHHALRLKAGLSHKRKKHVEQCLVCKQEQVDEENALKGHQSERRNVVSEWVSPDASDQVSLISETLVKHIPQSPHPFNDENIGPFHATFSVGGMTCASCSGTITRMVSELQGVADVSVSLITKSATVTIDRRDMVPTVVETVEDCGFECDLVGVERVTSTHEGQDETVVRGPRTVSLRVDGMFCRHCPEKLMNSLKPFESRLTILEPLTSHTSPNPILTLSYQPSPPDFTIRTIISALASSKSPPFEVSISQPLSVEERARAMHALERRSLFLRLAVCLITAIPTFIIGIVYMSLVPKSNLTRAFFMKPMWTGNTSRAQWAMFFLATPVMFYSAGLFHRRSIKELKGLWRRGSKTPIWRRFVRFGSMNLLISMGVSIAYFSSIALLALAASQPPSPSGAGDTTTYFDSVVFLTMFLLTGKCLEAYSKDRTADAISALGKLRPAEALLLVPDSDASPFTEEFSSSDADVEKGNVNEKHDFMSNLKPGQRLKKVEVNVLEIGDVVRVLQGSTPPADGVVISNEGSAFDESSLTGESKPVKKEAGDDVFVGTINKGKVVDIRITAVGGETMLDQIVKVVREGQTKRAPIERVADLLTGYFVPVVTLLAILTWVIWLGLGLGGVLPSDYLDIPIGGWPVWSLEFAIAVFVVACPCGVGLAAPTALLVGSGLAAKYGILVRGGGEAFQEAAQLDIVVFDKTGTLTEGGEPRVTDAEVICDETPWTEDNVLSIAAELESASSHPLAIAVRHFCETKIMKPTVKSVTIDETAGRGLKGTFAVPHCTAVIGNEAWMDEYKAIVSAEQGCRLDQWKAEGKSVILMALRDDSKTTSADCFRVVAVMAAADPLRPEARDVVDRLQKQGLGTWMITGDNVTTAKAVANNVGISDTNVIAGVLPHQKAERIAWLQKVGMKRKPTGWSRLWGKRLNERCIVAMIGDGINDAPALTTADVGLAIGSGSDVAISSASFILVQSNLYGILTLTDLSRKVFNRIKFNFLWAVMYNLAALPIAAGVIYPAGHARLNPIWASLAMALSSVSVVCSSLMLKLYREPKRR